MEPVLEYQGTRTEGGRRLRTLAAVLLAAAWLWTLADVGIIVGVHHWGIESILFAGPVLEVVGLIALGLGFAGRSTWAKAGAVAVVAFPVLIFALINWRHWSPSEARRPVPLLAGAFLVLLLPLVILAWCKRRV